MSTHYSRDGFAWHHFKGPCCWCNPEVTQTQNIHYNRDGSVSHREPDGYFYMEEPMNFAEFDEVSQPRRFWMVYSPQAHAPTKQHQSHEAALTEARRLAQKHPGRSFYVLVAEKGVHCHSPFDEWGLY